MAFCCPQKEHLLRALSLTVSLTSFQVISPPAHCISTTCASSNSNQLSHLRAICCFLCLDHSFLTLQMAASSYAFGFELLNEAFLDLPVHSRQSCLFILFFTVTCLMSVSPTLDCTFLEGKFSLFFTSVFSVLTTVSSTWEVLSQYLWMNEIPLFLNAHIGIQDYFFYKINKGVMAMAKENKVAMCDFCHSFIIWNVTTFRSKVELKKMLTVSTNKS